MEQQLERQEDMDGMTNTAEVGIVERKPELHCYGPARALGLLRGGAVNRQDRDRGPRVYLLDLKAAQLEATVEVVQLKEALASRDSIGKAKGILTAREECSNSGAFKMLVTLFQTLRVRVRDMAERVAAEAEEDSGAPRDFVPSGPLGGLRVDLHYPASEG